MDRLVKLLEPVRSGGWRLSLLTGLAAGLAISPQWSPHGGLVQAAIALFLILLLLVEHDRAGYVALVLIFVAASVTGTGIGGERLRSIDSGAFHARAGDAVTLSGFTTGEARSSRGITRIPFQTDSGKLLVETGDPPADLPTGSGIIVEGKARPPPDWYRATLKRQGIETIIGGARVSFSGQSRSGPSGWIDSMRNRAESALARGIPERESALARGFVLGQDADIDDSTTDNFQNSGLSHLLAVSGQNVVLLGLLAVPFMAMAGLGPRSRIVAVALLILVYVPLTGAGASIQRAAVMGLAGLTATLASRPGSRLYALSLAVAVTLALNPRAGADIGWQLSFAAVLGIFLLTGPIQSRLEVLIGESGWRSGLSIGIAVTVAATVATAPLIVFHFERLPVGTLAANLLAMPAVAPAMWLGMISAAIGQLHESLALPFNLINSLLLAYVAQVASWFGRPSWAVLEVHLNGPGQLALVYASMVAGLALVLRAVTPERLGRDRAPNVKRRARWLALTAAIGLVTILVLLPGLAGQGRRDLASPPVSGARVEVLDVGQGDAILIRPWGEDPILVDGGPPGGDLAGALDSAGIEKLAAVILTHNHLDHTGGLYDVFGPIEVGRFLFDCVPGDLKRMATDAGAIPDRISSGQKIASGPATMRVLWPPALKPGESRPEDPNVRSVVLELSVARFRMLLTGDAEYEAAPYETEPVDVLKVAHHGSDDAGLPSLLAADGPAVAVISVGEANRFGHPTPALTKELAEAGVAVHRTDREGTISVVIREDGYSVETGE